MGIILLIKKLADILPASDKGKFVFLFILMLIAAFLEVAGISMILAFVSIVADPDRITDNQLISKILNYFNIEDSRDLLVYGAIILISIFILKNIYLVLFNFVQARFLYNRFQSISTRLFNTYMNAPYIFFLQNNSAQLIRNVTSETTIITKYIIRPILFMAMETVMIVGIILFLIAIEPLISFIVLATLGGSGILFLKLLKKQTQNYGAQALTHRGKLIQEVNEGLGGFKDTTITNRQSWFIDRFQSHLKTLTKAEIFHDVAKNSTKPVIETIAVSGILIIALILVFQGRDIASIIPVLTLFSVASLRLMPALNKIVGDYNTLRYYGYAIEPIHEGLVKPHHEPTIKIDKSKRIKLRKSINIKNISYQYPESNETVINNISVTVPKGAAIALVGTSGAGKSTLADLILGLLKPDKGVIDIDGTNIHNNIRGWQKNIGYIPQFIYLSDNTIKSNIAFGLNEKEIDEKRLNNVVKIAQLEELINKLPKGLDTVIGERGIKLSGGQRQRIGIARALYHDPEVLIMDEATSSLDNQTEKYIIEAIERLKRDRTIIIIAHRLSTVKNCDIIYVLKKGEIVASGQYSELLHKSDDFKSLAGIK